MGMRRRRWGIIGFLIMRSIRIGGAFSFVRGRELMAETYVSTDIETDVGRAESKVRVGMQRI